jgi:hypothetical protein
MLSQGLSYSGAKGHNHCLESKDGLMDGIIDRLMVGWMGKLNHIYAVGNITDPRGYLWAVTPGRITLNPYHQW